METRSWLRTEQEGCNHSSTKNAKNGTEREDRSSTQNGTERNWTIQKKEQEWNDLAEGPRSRTEWKDFKKVRTCPALTEVDYDPQGVALCYSNLTQNHLVYSPVPSNTITWMDPLTSTTINTVFVKSLVIQDPPTDVQLVDLTSTADPTTKPIKTIISSKPDPPTKPAPPTKPKKQNQILPLDQIPPTSQCLQPNLILQLNQIRPLNLFFQQSQTHLPNLILQPSHKYNFKHHNSQTYLNFFSKFYPLFLINN